MEKEIQFNPELMLHIKTIYGNAKLNGKVLKQLYLTWVNNPDIIRNTAKQKTTEQKVNNTPFSKARLVEAHKGPMKLQSLNTEIANDDLSGVQSFKTAFREGKNRGLKFFLWKKTKENPSGLFSTVTRDEINSKYPDSEMQVAFKVPSVNDWIDLLSANAKTLQRTPVEYLPADFEPDEEVITVNKKQQGGTMNQQQGIEEQVIQLVQAAAGGDQQATLQIEQIMQAAQKGDQQAILIALIIQKVVEAMKQQLGIKAALGAKLDYIRKIKGLCPDGEELVYMKKGGRMCPVCQKKAEKAEDGKKLQKKNAVSDFKEKRKKINPNDTVNTKFGPRDLNGKTKYPKYDAVKENYDYETRKRVQEKDEKSGKKVFGSACGSKMKKK